jgi:hypothetical protein
VTGPASASRSAVLRFGLPVAAGSVLIGIALLFASHAAADVTGYLLCSLVPFLLVALERRAVVTEEARLGYGPGRNERWFARGILLVGLIGAAAHAWFFAWSIS